MFCDEAIWIDRGRIVKRGSSLEVTKAYQQFTRVLDERRLNAKNRKSWEGTTPSYALDDYADALDLRLRLADGSSVEIDRVRLLRDGKVEEEVAVGDAQDADGSHAAHLILEGSDWTSPLESDRGLARGLRAVPGGGVGSVRIDLYTFFEESRYAVELEARGRGLLAVEVLRGGKIVGRAEERLTTSWATVGASLARERAQVAAVGAAVSEADYDLPSRPGVDDVAADSSSNGSREIRHWPGEGTLAIEGVTLSGANGEQAIFEAGTPLTVTIDIRSHSGGTFPLTPSVVVYRLDGTRVTAHVGPPQELELEAGDRLSISLRFDNLNLGDGRYVLSAGLHRRLEQVGPSETYDLVDRSYEFEVIGNDPLLGGVFHHPAEWTIR